jgi:ribosomal-protein-alanine N-acetyltransferase
MVRLKLQSGQEANRPLRTFFSAHGGELWKRADNSGASSLIRWLSVARIWPFRCGYNVAVPFAIRDFKAEDFETLWQVDQQCFPPGISYSRQELKVYLRRKGSFTLVAVGRDGASIAGFIVAYGGPMGHIITIDVIEAARRSGVGSLLLKAAEERLQAAGSRAVGLETAVDNLAALSFYKRHGYSVIRTWPRYYSNGIDALVMKKELVAVQ